MIIGIVSNSAKVYMPLLSSLFNYKNKAGVMLYIGQSIGPDENPAETLRFCNAMGITIVFENDKGDLYNWQQMYQPDIIFFAGYSGIVKTHLLEGVRYGVFNIHFGLLPQFRGPSPVFWQLKNGNTEIGLAIHKMTNKIDSGAVIWQYQIANQPHINYDIAFQIFSELQIKGVIEILDTLNAGKKLIEVIQDENKAAYYHKPQLKDVLINWDEMEAKAIIDLVKACSPWNMGAITLINGIELKILDLNVTKLNKFRNSKPGTIILDKCDFFVTCKGNELLNLNFIMINSNYIPARFANVYGFKTGQKFVNNQFS